jgi:hypothetical protein
VLRSTGQAGTQTWRWCSATPRAVTHDHEIRVEF